MIVRTYGRRKIPGSDDAVSDVSLSQENSYNSSFPFSSQDSAFDSDPYALDDDELSILSPKKHSRVGDFGKKPKKGGDRVERGHFDSDQDHDDLAILPLSSSSGDFKGLGGEFRKKPKKGDRVGFKGGVSNSAFDSDPYALEDKELSILPPRKHGRGGDFENLGGNFHRRTKKGDRVSNSGVSAGTATLMETQECGEMMEHVDELNFALDGLRKGQPARIRRASLLSLLSICGTLQQRRLLRTHGMAKTIIDAVLSLTFDDEPSNLAAAALLFVLTADNQDDRLLDSPSCIRFLLKLLRPVACDASKNKALTIGNKLLSIRKDDGVLQDSSKGTDSTSAAIMLKIEEILVSCKQLKSSDGNDNAMKKPELSPKWISLLTMEKASLSTVALEDTVSGTVRKGGGHFKEKLRELGGLNAVFEVARNCHSIMESCQEQCSFSSQRSKDSSRDLESLAVLLKCLKIMENATFLSNDNQCHLLGMKGNLDDQGSPRNFVKLILSITKLLSGLSLSSSLSRISDDEKMHCLPNGTSEIPYKAESDSDEVILISSSSTECTSSQKSFSLSQNSRWLSVGSGNSGFSKSGSETSTTSAADTCFLKTRAKSSSSGSCSEMPTSSSSAKPSTSYGLRINLGLGKRCKVAEDPKFELLGNSEDPFAFDEDECEPSKWDIMHGAPAAYRPKNDGALHSDIENRCQSLMLLSQQESSNQDNNHHSDASCPSALDEDTSTLLADCLLAAVKVLMNLTNDNPEGCRQIGSCGGLETLSSLIACHFPSFSYSLPSFSEIEDYSLSSKSCLEVDNQTGSHLSDQELDFLVAILGLLVNLVEKDDENRYRLAAASVSLPRVEGLPEERHSGVIPLLCSIFLMNQGAGETSGEGKALSWDDDEAVLQGEKEAEKMIVEAYSALLLAFLSTESKSTRSAIAKRLPDKKLATLVPVLERFVEFHLTLNMISPETHTTVLEVIESCRMP